MSTSDRSSSARLWWAAPSALAVVGALAFAVGFAPRLAQHVRLPTAVVVNTPVTGVRDPAPTLRSRTAAARGHTGSPQPSRTPGLVPGQGSTQGTVVQPARPVVTSPPTEDDGSWRDPSASSSGDR